jgi:hypothetical protein
LKIVVIGGGGLIGKKLVKNLREQGPEVVAASPSSGVNALTGEGLAEALTGAALYFGIELDDQSLTPGDNPRIGPTRFDDWLSRSIPLKWLLFGAWSDTRMEKPSSFKLRRAYFRVVAWTARYFFMSVPGSVNFKSRPPSLRCSISSTAAWSPSK